ncbi:MAG: toprim domain-containing protein [Myxococcota bacterium]
MIIKHWVGYFRVNALSEAMEATVWREGHSYSQAYARGLPQSKLKKGGRTSKRGTAIHFRPDTGIFGKKLAFDEKRVRDRLEAKSYLHKGLKIVFRNAKGAREEFEHPEGISELLPKRIAEEGKPPVHHTAFQLERGGETDPVDRNRAPLRLELVLQWTEAPSERLETFANGIPTTNGGAHEAGLKTSLHKAIRGFIEAKGVKVKGVKITAEDIREGLVAILSVYVAEPQFQGQTKQRLNNPEVAGQVESLVRTALEQWLLDNTSTADAIVARIVIAARAREASRAASKAVSRKTAISHRLNLPGKLSDCQSTNPDESELFLVEGDSAGGNAKQARDRRTQAILPLRGKVLNVERKAPSEALKNKELQNIVDALGCGIGKSFDISKLRYGKVFLLMDADADGHHISTLLLTFFYRMLPGLVRAGNVYLSLPPLYRIDIGKETHWALDDADRDRVLAGANGRAKPDVSRFKGLGEMPASDLRETTLDPTRRRALRVVIDGALETDQLIGELMGRDAAPRYRFIMEHAPRADADDLDL